MHTLYGNRAGSDDGRTDERAARPWMPALFVILACLALTAARAPLAVAQLPTTQTAPACQALSDGDWCEEWVSTLDFTENAKERVARQSAKLSRDGRQLFVMVFISRSIAVAAFDTATGESLWASERRPVSAGAGFWPPVMAVSPDASKVFVVATETATSGATGGTSVTLAYNAVAPRSPGDPALGELLWTKRGDVAGATAGITEVEEFGQDVAVTPNGSTVLVLTTRAIETELLPTRKEFVTTAYDAASGERLWRATYALNRGSAQSIVVSPDGAVAYVTGHLGAGSVTIAYHVRGESAGQQRWVATDDRLVLMENNKLAVSDDGKRVFTVGTLWLDTPYSYRSRIATAAYDAASGSVLWNAEYEGGPGYNSPAGKNTGGEVVNVRPITVSPDNELVFVTGAAQDAEGCSVWGCQIPVLAYEQATGALRWSQTHPAPGGSHPNAVGTGLAMSRDGGQLFVTGWIGRFDSAPGNCSSLGLTCWQLALALDARDGRQLARGTYPSDFHLGNVGLPSPDGRRVYFVSANADGRRPAIVSRLLERRADLSLRMAPSRERVRVGETLGYTLAVGNAGPEDALGATLQTHLPDGLELVSANTTSGRCGAASAGTLTCWLDGLPTGSSTTVDLVVEAKKTGTVITTARVWGAKRDDAEPSDNYIAEATVVEGDGPPAPTTGGLAAAITEPAPGAEIPQHPDAPLNVAGAVRFKAPEPSTTKFHTNGCSGGPLTQADGGTENISANEEQDCVLFGGRAADVDEQQLHYTTQANDGVPLTLDASRPLEGVVRIGSTWLGQPSVGSLHHGCQGEMTIDVTLAGLRVGESAPRTLATATETFTLPITTSYDEKAISHRMRWTTPAPTALDRAEFASLSLTLVLRGPYVCDQGFIRADVTVPTHTASFDRRVELSVDDAPFSADGVSLSEDGTTWSATVPTPAPGPHTLRARPVHGANVGPATGRNITIVPPDALPSNESPPVIGGTPTLPPLTPTTGGGNDPATTVGTQTKTVAGFRITAPKRYSIRKGKRKLPLTLTLPRAAKVTVMLSGGRKRVARASRALKAGKMSFKLKVPKRMRKGTHTLTISFAPRGERAVTVRLRLRVVK